MQSSSFFFLSFFVVAKNNNNLLQMIEGIIFSSFFSVTSSHMKVHHGLWVFDRVQTMHTA